MGGYVFIGEIENGARVAAIEDGGQPRTFREWFHHDIVDFLKLELLCKGCYVIHNMSGRLEIEGQNGLIKAILFIPIQILRLCAVAAVMQEEAVAGLGIVYQPLHPSDNIGTCGSAHGVLLVVGQDHRVRHCEAVILLDELFDVVDIVDTSFQLLLHPKVIDSDE